MLSLGLASFFSVGGLAEQLGGVHSVPLVVLSCDTHRSVRIPRHTYKFDPRTGRLGAGPPCSRVGQLWAGLPAGAPLLAG